MTTSVSVKGSDWSCASKWNWGLRTIDCYSKSEVVGEGTYGQVWKGKCRLDGRPVALKKIRVDPYRKGHIGTPLQTLREIRILNSYGHPNIVELIEVVTSAKTYSTGVNASLYLVFEYMQHDLGGLIDYKIQNKLPFTEDEIRAFFLQLIRALNFMHQNRVCHRDIKSSNLLISNSHVLKVADFGLARQIVDQSKANLQDREKDRYTNKVVTLWYRAPELLLGEEHYGFSVDIWSAGCILLEMWIKMPCFQGRDEMDQVRRIFKLCGSPSVKEWPDLANSVYSKVLSTYTNEHPEKESRKMDKYLESNQVSSKSKEMIISLLQLNPNKRPSAQEILDSEYMKETIEPTKLPKLRLKESCHEYETRKRKKELLQPGSVGKQLQAKEEAVEEDSQVVNEDDHAMKRQERDERRYSEDRYKRDNSPSRHKRDGDRGRRGLKV